MFKAIQVQAKKSGKGIQHSTPANEAANSNFTVNVPSNSNDDHTQTLKTEAFDLFDFNDAQVMTY